MVFGSSNGEGSASCRALRVQRLLPGVDVLNAVSLVFECAAIGPGEVLPTVVLALILVRRSYERREQKGMNVTTRTQARAGDLPGIVNGLCLIERPAGVGR